MFRVKFLPVAFNHSRPLLINSARGLQKLARRLKWEVRAPRKLTPISFVRGVLWSVSEGHSSFRHLATRAGLQNDITISRQALWERVGPQAVKLFEAVLSDLLSRVANLSPKQSLPNLPGVRRILVQDSTVLNLHKSLNEVFPAGKNQHGVSAALRWQALFDLVSGAPVHLSLTPYSKNDQSESQTVIPLLEKGDLLLRDLGYFCAQAFTEITQQSAWYISRHLVNRVLHLPFENGGKRLDLADHLRRHAPSPGDVVDLELEVGGGQKDYPRFPARLIARRVPLHVLADRLRKVNEQDRKQQPGRQRSKRYKELLAWEIYLTNLPADQLTMDDIAKLYRLRWRVEMVFKALKSHTPLKSLARHRSNPNHVQVLIYAWLCLMVMTTATGGFALATRCPQSGALIPNDLSLLKVLPTLFSIVRELLPYVCIPDPKAMLQRLLKQMQYHDRYEKRNDRFNMAEMLSVALRLT